VNFERQTAELLDQVLALNGRAAKFSSATPLLGALPELDSMAVVNLLAGMEDRFGIAIADDEISADTFATLGSLAEFLKNKLTLP
jgi:acyl carrier protein